MMVGLPAAGKSKWAENYSQEHPEMNVNILGTNFIMDKMKVLLHTCEHAGSYREWWPKVNIGLFNACINNLCKN